MEKQIRLELCEYVKQINDILSDDGNYAIKLDQLKQAIDDVVSNL